ncbi:MAG: hypothetical protein ACTSV2_00735 [Candidatus Thorarchaeota archaeon]
MIEKTGQVIRCSVEQTSRFNKKIKLKLLTDDGLHHDLVFLDNYSGYVPLVGTRITVRVQNITVVEVVEVNGSPPNLQMTPKVNTNATGTQMILAVLVVISGVLLCIISFGSPLGGILILFGVGQIIVGFLLHQTLRREIAFLAFILNLFAMMASIVPWSGGSIYINPATALFQLALLLLQITLLCTFLCPKSMEIYYG